MIVLQSWQHDWYTLNKEEQYLQHDWLIKNNIKQISQHDLYNEQ